MKRQDEISRALFFRLALARWSANRNHLLALPQLPSRRVEWTELIGRDAANAADAPPVPPANCSGPGCLKLTFPGTGRPEEWTKWEFIQMKVIWAERREQERKPAALWSRCWSGFIWPFWLIQIFQVVANIFCPQVVKKFVALWISSKLLISPVVFLSNLSYRSVPSQMSATFLTWLSILIVRCSCFKVLSRPILSYGWKSDFYFEFQLISKSALTRQLSVLRALESAEQFLFEWKRIHAGFCAHMTSDVLKKIYFVAEKMQLFFSTDVQLSKCI